MQRSDDTGQIIFACDEPGCDVTLKAESGNIDAANARLRGSMWGESHDGETARHHCPAHAGWNKA